jgi:hypothetical protein
VSGLQLGLQVVAPWSLLQRPRIPIGLVWFGLVATEKNKPPAGKPNQLNRRRVPVGQVWEKIHKDTGATSQESAKALYDLKRTFVCSTLPHQSCPDPFPEKGDVKLETKRLNQGPGEDFSSFEEKSLADPVESLLPSFAPTPESLVDEPPGAPLVIATLLARNEDPAES